MYKTYKLDDMFTPFFAPPVEKPGATPPEEELPPVDLPGDGGEIPPEGGDGLPTGTVEGETPPGEIPPEGGEILPEGGEIPPVDPNAALLDQIAVLQQQTSDLQEQLTAASSDNEKLEEENKSILDLEHDDLVAMVTENPHGLIESIFNEVKSSVMTSVGQKNDLDKRNSSIEGTIEAYAKDNSDFEKLWDNGEIQGYMNNNPGHNAMSAHQMLTIAARIAGAKKEGAEEASKDFTTKLGSQTIGAGVNIPPSQRDAAVKDTKKFGGRAKVAASRAGLL